jgi:cbb3-type cytochrome c oxidase subunit III
MRASCFAGLRSLARNWEDLVRAGMARAASGVALALVLGASLAGAPARAAGPAESANASAGQTQTPAAIYHNYCSVCHGDRGDGQSRARGSLNPPPRDFTTAQASVELSRARMLTAVKHGVPGTAMVGWGTQLSEKQVEAVVDYVRENFMRASNATAAAEGSGRGRQIYAKSCSVCHGDRGAGSVWASANLKPSPRDFTAPAARTELTRERMLAAVTAGRPGTAMAGFATQLPPADIEAVVDYVRTAFMRVGADAGISGTQAHGATLPGLRAATAAPGLAANAAPSADMSLPLPQGLVGDLAAGKRFYDANCATCHGVKGDGQGPRAYFINPKPRNFLTPESRAQFNRPALYAAVFAGRLGTEMPAWSKVLGPQEMANVSEYVFRSFVQPGGVRQVGKAGQP